MAAMLKVSGCLLSWGETRDNTNMTGEAGCQGATKRCFCVALTWSVDAGSILCLAVLKDEALKLQRFLSFLSVIRVSSGLLYFSM